MQGAHLIAVAVTASMLLTTVALPTAQATHDRALLELDGNVADATPGAPFDWQALFTASGVPIDLGGSLIASSFGADSAKPDATYHSGSDKDTEDMTTWQCAPTANPQDKTDLLNAYGALFLADSGSYYLYFGFERATNNGNSFMGFWVLQNGVSCAYPPGATVGNFTTGHTPGDLLVLSEFTGGGTVSSVKVLRWNPAVTDNLELVVAKGDCAVATPNDPVCARVNSAPLPTPWVPGSSAPLAVNTFFEGGLNLTALTGAAGFPCFTQLMAETRTSQEFSAQLKDYSIQRFAACDARISVDPLAAVNDVGDPHTFTFLVEKDTDGTGYFPAAGELVTATLGGEGSFDGADTCTTAADGTCSVTIVSTHSGASTVTGSVDVVIAQTTLHRATDGANGNSGPATKTWVAIPSTIVTSPTATDIVLGGAVSDNNAVSGDLGPATGTVTTYVCSPSEVAAHGGTCASGGTLVGVSTLVDGQSTSPPFTPTSAGTWCFRADYSGDDTYDPSSEHAPTQCFTVAPGTPTLSTVSLPNMDGVAPGSGVADSATVFGLGGDFAAPTGSVQFFLCAPDEITVDGCPAGFAVGSAALDGSGVAVSPVDARTTMIGKYCWRAVYLGDANYVSVSHTNADTECFTVRQALPTLTKAVRHAGSDALTDTIPAQPGDTIEFVLVVQNSGNADATDVHVHDVVPDHATFLSCSDACSASGTGPGSSVDWDLGTVAPGTRTVTFRVVLDESFPEGTTVVPNVATLTTATTPQTPSNVVEVIVEAHALLSLAKSVDLTAAEPGDIITYTLVATNDGDAPAAGVVISDTIPAYTTFVSCSDGCATDGSTPGSLVSWELNALVAGASRAVSFSVILDETFESSVTVVPNVASVASDTTAPTPSNIVQTIVTAAPALGLFKAADHAVALESDEVTYTLAYFNTGNGGVQSAVITEQVPSGAAFVSCSPACVASGDTITWTVGPIPTGTSALVPAGTVQMTVEVTEQHGCAVCNVATIASAEQDGGAPMESNEVCFDVLPDVASAFAAGAATGIRIVSSTLGIDERTGTSAAARLGPGDVTDSDTQRSLAVPMDGSIARADLVTTLTTLSVSKDGGARSLSVAEITNLNIMGGLVTASKLRAVADSDADESSTSISATGTVIEDLRVSGQSVGVIAPGERIPLPGFGGSSYAAVNERVGHTFTPLGYSGGVFRSELDVIVLRVHLSDIDPLMPGPQPLDILVGSTSASALFPQRTTCEVAPDPVGTAEAFVAGALTARSGETRSPHSGGSDAQTLTSVSAGPSSAGASASSTSIVVEGALVVSSAFAEAKDVCALDDGLGGCLISATLLRSVVTSQSDQLIASSSAAGTEFNDLVIAGVRVDDAVAPNTVIDIPGVGFAIVNERTEDATEDGHSGLRIRALHVVLTVGPRAGEEIILVEAHSLA